MFYLVRLLIYHREAQDLEDKTVVKAFDKQYTMMQRRLITIIGHPAMIITWIAGIVMLVNNPAFLQQGWMHMKLFFLVILTAYHLYSGKLVAEQREGIFRWNSQQLRMINEIPTLLMVAIVFLAVLKNGLNATYAILAFIGLLIILMVAIRMYKRSRERKNV